MPTQSIKQIEYFENKLIEEKVNFFILNKEDGDVENFGKQWRDYRDIQIDSKNNFFISKDYMNKMLFNDFDIIKNKEVLEIGSGAGRFTEYFAKYAKKCVSIDLSSAIYYNVSLQNENIIFIKSDFNKLKPSKKFDIVFCRGVLQHTPFPMNSLKNIHSFVKKDGYVFFDIYKMPKIGYLHPKYFFWRPLIKNYIKYENFERFLKKNIYFLLLIKRLIKKIFLNSNFISDCFIPIWDYKGVYNLSDKELEQWAIMDTLDGIYAKYDYPQNYNKIKKFLIKNKIKIISSNKNLNIFKTQISNDY